MDIEDVRESRRPPRWPAATLRQQADRLPPRAGTSWIPAAIVALAGGFLLWTRLIPLGNSLWNDEIHSASAYIIPGPSGIWGDYTPNDHMLFELLSWITSMGLDSHVEATYRFWSVLPSLAAVTVLTAWAWRRFDPWVAAMFAAIAVTAPLFMTLSIQARGYGLGSLASALVLIGADALGRDPSRGALWCFAVGGLVGILTLPTFGLPFGCVAVILLALRPGQRRPVARAVAAVAVISLGFYIPVLSEAVSSARNLTGNALPWHGFITGPLGDLVAPSVQLLHRQLSDGVAEVIGGCVLAFGLYVLFSSHERLFAALVVVPAVVTYSAFELLRATSADRFMSFLMLPLLLLAAVAVVAAGRLLAQRGTVFTAVAIVLGVAFALTFLRRGEYQFSNFTNPPIENWREAAMLASREPAVITNSYYANSLDFYEDKPVRKILDPVQLAAELCGHEGAFAYVEHIRAPSPRVSVDCLVKRGAVKVPMKQLRGAMNVWLVPPAA